MKATELRLGNYINDRGGKTLRIDFFEYLENGFDCKFGQKIFIQGEEVHPMTEYTEYATAIPITEDWLVKFGFVQYDKISYELRISSEYVVKLDITLPSCETFIIEGDADDIEDKNFVCIPIKCKYVHQLQNLYFALTGEELTLNSNP